MKKIIALLVITIAFLSCEKKDPSLIDPTTDDDINYFIWKGLNRYYLWQKNVPDLADTRFSNFDDLYTYFRGYSSSNNVFESLLDRPTDRFSGIVEDYVALENSFQSINTSSGMEFGSVLYKNGSDNVFGYARYVVPNTDAAEKGVTRGMIFNTINGTQLTRTNYRSLLYGSSTSYTVGFADFNNGNPISNGNSVSLIKTEIAENPIAISKIVNEGNKKVGYLLYNQFSSNFDTQLNTVFANFKAENIDELIVDLRYNPGGFVSSAIYLGSMITGQFTGQLYSQQVWNDKIRNSYSKDSFIDNFTDEIRKVDANGNVILQENINGLGLNKVYFIVTYGSASASELVINSLSSYIDVRVIGETTRGKQVGSITLYDSDDLFKTGSNLNPNHRWAMQPLVLEISNKDNVNYPEGIVPGSLNFSGIELSENYGDLGVLGERSDPLLNAALLYISGGNKSSIGQKEAYNYQEIYSSKLATSASDYMFVELKK